MTYCVGFKPRARKDLQALDKREAGRIIEKIEALREDLTGDVKKLTNFTPEYRLRVGSYRVLFALEDNKIIVYRVRHRKDVYK
ncbi:type II toxin-antitoxin system RelE/ParE family toxin [soil metagenome]